MHTDELETQERTNQEILALGRCFFTKRCSCTNNSHKSTQNCAVQPLWVLSIYISTYIPICYNTSSVVKNREAAWLDRSIDKGDECMTWGKSALVTLHQQSCSLVREKKKACTQQYSTVYLYIGVPALYVTIAHS